MKISQESQDRQNAAIESVQGYKFSSLDAIAESRFYRAHSLGRSPSTAEAPKTRLTQFLKTLVNWLAGESGIGSEPKVTWKRDRQGRSYYEVIDSMRHQTHKFDTAQATRIWLESRYNQP